LKKKYLKKKSQSRYISHLRGGALIHLIAVEVYKFVKVTNVINLANFDGCMLRGFGFCKGSNLGFPIES
jgi:hypothetical protein